MRSILEEQHINLIKTFSYICSSYFHTLPPNFFVTMYECSLALRGHIRSLWKRKRPLSEINLKVFVSCFTAFADPLHDFLTCLFTFLKRLHSFRGVARLCTVQWSIVYRDILKMPNLWNKFRIELPKSQTNTFVLSLSNATWSSYSYLIKSLSFFLNTCLHKFRRMSFSVAPMVFQKWVPETMDFEKLRFWCNSDEM